MDLSLDRFSLFVFLEVLVFILTAYTCFINFRSWRKLNHVPGPFWAQFTNFQRVRWVLSRRAHEHHTKAHECYGDFVRFGPNMVSISNPELIPTVYPIRPGFPKSDFYKVLMPYTRQGALPAVFNTRDEVLHKQIKSPIAPLFSQSSTQSLEIFVDQVLRVTCDQFDKRFVATGSLFDLGDWLQYFAFDVMGTLTFSKRYGFLEQGKDVNNMLSTIWTYMQTTAPVTQIPWYDEWWNKNPWIAYWRAPFGLGILRIVADCCAQREAKSLPAENSSNDPEKASAPAATDEALNHRDMLSRFMEIQRTNPSVPPWAVKAWTFSNVIAGSDSTGVILKTIMHNLLSHPKTLHQLREELRTAQLFIDLSNATTPFPSWTAVRDLPYLEACINEGVRMHPPFCLPLERVVPKGGLTIGGKFFEEGTVVGMSPWVVNRHKGTWGEDSEEWRPERWLEGGEERKKLLEGSMLTFGSGRRVCLGKHIAILEMKKLVPTLVLRYEFDYPDPSTFWVENSWFFRQKGLLVKINKVLDS